MQLGINVLCLSCDIGKLVYTVEENTDILHFNTFSQYLNSKKGNNIQAKRVKVSYIVVLSPQLSWCEN